LFAIAVHHHDETYAYIMCDLLTVDSWNNEPFCRQADLSFVAAPALAPPDVPLDAVQMQQYEEELRSAADVPLPPDDDDEAL
jgi:hypothetical protein